MLNATAQKLGDSTVLRCQGRIVLGDAYVILRNAVLSQTHTRTLILRRERQFGRLSFFNNAANRGSWCKLFSRGSTLVSMRPAFRWT
jgi:hypothetical protein